MPNVGRRGLLLGLGATLIAAPAIVRAASLMPVRGVVMNPYRTMADDMNRFLYGDTLSAVMVADAVELMRVNCIPPVYIRGEAFYRVPFFDGRTAMATA